MVEKLTAALSKEHDVSVAAIYQHDTDWLKLVDSIFAHDKVICWW